MNLLVRLAAPVTLALLAGTAARAAIIDFTNMSTFGTRTAAEASGSAAGVDFVLKGSVDKLTYNTSPGEAPGAVAGLLAGEGDGIGLGGDEISGSQYLSISFSRDVRLTAVYLLDFFSGMDDSTMAVYDGAIPGGATAIATGDGANNKWGFSAVTLSRNGRTFSFDAGAGNEKNGVFALAGLEFETVPLTAPLPASAIMLGTAFLAGGVACRRRLKVAKTTEGP